MNKAKALQQQAYDLFASEDYQGSYEALLKLEFLQGPSPQLANGMDVTLFKADLLNQALARFKQAAELESKSIVTDNLIKVIRELKHEQHKSKPNSPSSNTPSLFSALSKRLFADVMDSWCQDSANTLFQEARKLSGSEWLQAMVDDADSGCLNKHLPSPTGANGLDRAGRADFQHKELSMENLGFHECLSGTASLCRAQVQPQADTAMLAQTNPLPQQALSLLQ